MDARKKHGASASLLESMWSWHASISGHHPRMQSIQPMSGLSRYTAVSKRAAVQWRCEVTCSPSSLAVGESSVILLTSTLHHY